MSYPVSRRVGPAQNPATSDRHLADLQQHGTTQCLCHYSTRSLAAAGLLKHTTFLSTRLTTPFITVQEINMAHANMQPYSLLFAKQCCNAFIHANVHSRQRR